MGGKRVSWAASGDINAFFGLMLDNVADLLLAVALLSSTFAFPTRFALTHMVPGTALGVLIGDLLFFVLAIRLARATGRDHVTAMPLGLDTPSTFGMVFLVLGPAFRTALGEGLSEDAAALRTWHIGICCIVISGLFKLVCALWANWVRRVIPRAGLLGSLAAIALVLISFLPLLEMLQAPLVAVVSLTLILATLVARLPIRLPGALVALIVGGGLYYLARGLTAWGLPILGSVPAAEAIEVVVLPREWLGALRMEWLGELGRAAVYFPIVIPFALATVVGGIDCTESAAAAGDEYDTRSIIGVEAFATLVAGLCGGVIQSTPYIGHPAYKAMGGRAAYTLLTALFIGGAGLLGYFGLFYAWVPKAAVFPILIFVGLEITAQSFQATPRRHYAAIALACTPALAYLAQLIIDKYFSPVAQSELAEFARHELLIIDVMANGFLITGLLWASALAAMIDGRLTRAAGFLGTAAAGTLCGLIHSPYPGAALHFPIGPVGESGGWGWTGPFFATETRDLMRGLFWGYVLSAVILLVWRKVADVAPREHAPEGGPLGHTPLGHSEETQQDHGIVASP